MTSRTPSTTLSREKNHDDDAHPRSDPANPFGYVSIRGHVVAVVEDGAIEHVERLSQRYFGKPYPWWQPGEVREIFRIAIDRVRTVDIR